MDHVCTFHSRGTVVVAISLVGALKGQKGAIRDKHRFTRPSS